MAKQRVKRFDSGGEIDPNGDAFTADEFSTPVQPAFDPVDLADTDVFTADEFGVPEQPAFDPVDQQALIAAGVPPTTVAAIKTTPGLWDKIVAKFTDSKTGDLNWANIAKAVIPAAGGVAALIGNNNAGSGAQGYQGGIPSLTLSRTKNAIPTDRRPGAGGVSYFSPTTFLGQRNMAPGPAGGTAGSVTAPPVGVGGGTSAGGTGGISSLPTGTGGGGGSGSSSVKAPTPTAGTGAGMWVGGRYLTKADIDKFYASGGDDRQFAQMASIAPGQDRELILQARQIAGNGTMAGDNALKHYFAEYQKYNPNGAYANNYAGYVNDIKSNPAKYNAIVSGTYTGTANASADSIPGGIYGPGTGHDFSYQQSGTGARGMGDGWNAGAWDGSRPAATPTPAAPATPSSSDIMAWYTQHKGDANFQQEAQQAMQQYGITPQQVAAAGVPTGAVQQPAASPTPSAPSDWNRYMQLNPDLGAAGINTAAAAQQHWQQYGQNENRQFAKGGGISGLPGAAPARGRFLRGPGDGVSDSIPARIDGKQEARLADGEFVVPARIVSELGNGSSEAGSRKLYAMLDRIEKTRHRNKSTAKNTRADKHLPA